MKLSISSFALINGAIAHASGGPHPHEPRAVKCAAVTPLIPKKLLPTAQSFCFDFLKVKACTVTTTATTTRTIAVSTTTISVIASAVSTSVSTLLSTVTSPNTVPQIVTVTVSTQAEATAVSSSTETLTFLEYTDPARLARAAPTKPAQWAALAGRELSSACSCIVSAFKTTVTLLQTSTIKTTSTVRNTITVSSVANAVATKVVTVTGPPETNTVAVTLTSTRTSTVVSNTVGFAVRQAPNPCDNPSDLKISGCRFDPAFYDKIDDFYTFYECCRECFAQGSNCGNFNWRQTGRPELGVCTQNRITDFNPRPADGIQAGPRTRQCPTAVLFLQGGSDCNESYEGPCYVRLP